MCRNQLDFKRSTPPRKREGLILWRVPRPRHRFIDTAQGSRRNQLSPTRQSPTRVVSGPRTKRGDLFKYLRCIRDCCQRSTRAARPLCFNRRNGTSRIIRDFSKLWLRRRGTETTSVRLLPNENHYHLSLSRVSDAVRWSCRRTERCSSR
jgi:hypothetical protein